MPKAVESDNEFLRAKVLTSFYNSKGTKIEPSTTEILAQNGGIEHIGTVIKAKARAIRIGANLLEDLWMEITKVAVYLVNRLPREANG
jgi:hypothetical protein